MEQTILVAGGTGNLGEMIVKALIKRGAKVRAITRQETDPEKVEKLKELGAEVVSVEVSNAEELKMLVRAHHASSPRCWDCAM